MSEHPQHGVGKTGGLPGANADPLASRSNEDEVAELMATDVSTQEPASEPPHDEPAHDEPAHDQPAHDQP
jgi:hypothetical protein